MSEEKKKKEENGFSLIEVPSQFGLAFKTPEGETLDANQLLVRIANDIKAVKSAVA